LVEQANPRLLLRPGSQTQAQTQQSLASQSLVAFLQYFTQQAPVALPLIGTKHSFGWDLRVAYAS
jgi:hypothetical protein